MGRYNRNGGQPKRDDGRKRDKYGVLLNVPGVYKDGIKIVKPKAIEVDMSASFKKAHALPALPAPSAVMQRVNLSHENRQLISELIEDNASSLSTLTLNDDIGGGKQERGSDQMEPIVATSSTDPAPSKQASAKRSKPRNHGSHSSSVPSDGKMDAVSAQLLQTFQDRQHTPAHKKMSKSRSLLPAWQHREHIVSSVASHQVVIISGETGCGKSTQVPQFLLHDCIEQGRGSSANIICTQPRRISAIGVAQRVAAEMCEDVGRTVGYNIRLEKCESRDTRLLFCTTGVLLRRLEGSSSDRGDGLQGVSHIIVDEVHERSEESDFLLMVLRDLLPKHPNLRVILMSATMNAQLFSAYFGGAPIFTIPGRTFPVQAFFLEHALELTGHKVTAGADWARSRPGGKGGVLTDASRDQERVLKNAPISERDDELLQLSELRQRYHVPEPSANEFEMPAAAKPSGERFSESTVQALYALDHTSIDLALIVDLVVWFVQQRQQNLRQAGIASTSSAPPLPIDSSLDATDLFWGDDEPTLQSGQPAKLTAKSKAAAPIAAPNPVVENIVQHARGLDGSILIFMPGMKEISNLYDLLLACPAISQLHPNQNKWIFPLHSTLSSEEQLRVFASPPRPERVGPSFRFAQKIVIATNIAETSITIDDCVCVIDAARMKETRFDPTKKMASLDECFVSRANAMQRRGRAGRVAPGIAFHLVTAHRFQRLPKQQLPEMHRVPLEQTCLRVKILGYPGSLEHVFSNVIDPPDPSAVQVAVHALVQLQALQLTSSTSSSASSQSTEVLTALGYHLAALPVDVRVGKLILFGAIFSCLDSVLTIAALLSVRSPFVAPFDKRDEADAAKSKFSVHQSDHLTMLRAYNEWNAITNVGDKWAFCRENFLSGLTLDTVSQMKRQLLELVSECGFAPPNLRSKFVEGVGRRVCTDGVKECIPDAYKQNDLNHLVIKAVLTAALYPRVVKKIEGKGGRGDSGKSASLKFFVHELPTADDDAESLAAPIPQQPAHAGRGKKHASGKQAAAAVLAPPVCRDIEVSIHPSSVCKDLAAAALPSSFLIYSEKVRTTQVYVREVTVISPLSLLLFGGSLVHSGASIFVDDEWIQFSIAQSVSDLIRSLRTQLDSLLDEKIKNPALDFHSDTEAEVVGTVAAQGRKTIVAIVTLLTSERETKATQAPLTSAPVAQPTPAPSRPATAAPVARAPAAKAAPLPLPIARPSTASASGKAKPPPIKYANAEEARKAKIIAAKLKRGETVDGYGSGAAFDYN